jgi:hypothetical protein
MKILTQTLQHRRNLCTCTQLRHCMSCHVSNEKMATFEVERSHLPQGESKKPFKGHLVGFRAGECGTSTSTTSTSSEKNWVDDVAKFLEMICWFFSKFKKIGRKDWKEIDENPGYLLQHILGLGEIVAGGWKKGSKEESNFPDKSYMKLTLELGNMGWRTIIEK